MATPIDPAGSASAALNTQTRAVQKPPQTQVNVNVPVATENTRPAQTANDVAQTSRVNPESRVGNFIDTTA